MTAPKKTRYALRWLVAGALAAVVGVIVISAATPSLLWVLKPTQGQRVGLEGVEVMVRFPDLQRVDPGSFRVLLNGADVTAQVTTAANGAAGRLFGVLDGENVLRFEVRGDRGGFPHAVVEESREVRVLVRRPENLDRG